MVDGDEEVDTILFEFNVSVCCLFVCLFVCLLASFDLLGRFGLGLFFGFISKDLQNCPEWSGAGKLG
jgi:hypothetical protein